MRGHAPRALEQATQPDAHTPHQQSDDSAQLSPESAPGLSRRVTHSTPQRIVALQRLQGNQAVQRTLKRAPGRAALQRAPELQRHWIPGEPEDEEIKNQMGLQRSLAPGAASLQRRTRSSFQAPDRQASMVGVSALPRTRPSFETVGARRLVQRNWLTDQFSKAVAFFQDLFSGGGQTVDGGAKGTTDGTGAKTADGGAKTADGGVKGATDGTGAKSPIDTSGAGAKLPVDMPKGTTDTTDGGTTGPKGTTDSTGAAPTGTDAPKITADQVKLDNLSFSVPEGIPADGATTTQGKVSVTPSDRALTWGFIGPEYGSRIDANGLLTPGADTGGAEMVNLQVKVADSEFPTVATTGAVKLYDAKVYKAVLDYEQFVKNGPYSILNHTVGLNGKFDIAYTPAAQLAQVTVKIKYDFSDDQEQPTDTDVIKKQRQERQDKYRQTYHDMIVNGWSKRYQFQNVHEPKSIWGRLNPITVQVDVQEVKNNQHFTIDVAAANQANARVGGGVTRLGKNLDPQLAFNGPGGTGPSELARVEKIIPKVQFDNDSAEVPPAAQAPLTLLAEYLRRMNNPQFKFTIVGHASATGKDAHNQELSEKRAANVAAFLKSNGVTNHLIETSGVGATGATVDPEWRKVDITAALPTGWQNKQDVTLHEFGHMIGLGDEYVGNGRVMGSPATHYDLVKKAFGKDYADLTAKVDGDRASLMEGGDDVRMYHYVTFWDATVQAAAKAPAPVPAFTHDDWKFIG